MVSPVSASVSALPSLASDVDLGGPCTPSLTQLRRGFTRLYFPKALKSSVQIARNSSDVNDNTDVWTIQLEKHFPSDHIDSIEQLQPQILPPEGVAALERQAALESQSAGPRSMNASNGLPQTSQGEGSLQQLASQMLKNALSNENAARRTQGLQTMELWPEDEEDDAEPQDPTFSSAQIDANTSKAAVEKAVDFGYGFRSAFRGSLGCPNAGISRAYALGTNEPGTVPFEAREAQAVQEEEEKWDVERYM